MQRKVTPRSSVSRESSNPESVTVRENRAVAKDRGRPLTSTFLPYQSYLKRISTVTFAEVEVLFPTRYKFSLILGPLVTKNT